MSARVQFYKISNNITDQFNNKPVLPSTFVPDSILHKRISYIPDLIDLEPDNPEQKQLARARSLRLLEGKDPIVAMSSYINLRAEKGKGKAVEAHSESDISNDSVDELTRKTHALALAAERRESLANAKVPIQLMEILRSHTPERVLAWIPVGTAAPTNWNWVPGGYNDNFKVDPTKPEYGWPVEGGTLPKLNASNQWVEAVITPAAVKWYDLIYGHVKKYVFEKEYIDVPGWSALAIGYGNGRFKAEIFPGYPLRHFLHNLAISGYVTTEEKEVLFKYNRLYTKAVGLAKSGYQITAEYILESHLGELIYDIERILCRPSLLAENRMDEYDLSLPLRLAEDKKEASVYEKEFKAEMAGMTKEEKLKELIPETHDLAEAMMGIDGRPIKVARPIRPPPKTRAEKRAAKKEEKKILKKAEKGLPYGWQVFKGGEQIVDGRIEKVGGTSSEAAEEVDEYKNAPGAEVVKETK